MEKRLPLAIAVWARAHILQARYFASVIIQKIVTSRLVPSDPIDRASVQREVRRFDNHRQAPHGC